ncbi:MAG: TIM barrel protein, partial [Clostridia bacterium]
DYALNKVVETFSELADYGQGYNASVGIEGAYGHVCYCVERLNEAIKSINKSNTKVVFDLYNYLSCDNFEQRYQILGNGLKLFENNIVAYHLKDCIVDGNKLVRCSVGKGIFDYERILSAIYEVDSNASLVLEGTCGEDIANSVEFIRKIMSKIETNNNKSNKE